MSVSLPPGPPPHKKVDFRHLPAGVLYGTDGIPEQGAPVQGACFVINSDLLPAVIFHSLCMHK